MKMYKVINKLWMVLFMECNAGKEVCKVGTTGMPTMDKAMSKNVIKVVCKVMSNRVIKVVCKVVSKMYERSLRPILCV
jgi:hypothetical protein